jgi:PrtD family type I secretion system ABC transporter
MIMTQQTDLKNSENKGLVSWFFAMGRELPGYFLPILAFSLVSNLLLLVSPLYMLQVYDRILTSGSKDTLIWITIISVFLLGIYAAAETGRRRICSLAAEDLEEKISERIFTEFDKTHDAGGRLPNDLRVLSRIRGFFQNQTVLPFFDLPFAPFFLLVMFMIHPIIGALGLIGGLILLGVAIFAEVSARRTNETAAAVSSEAFNLASGLSRQRSAIVAMGLTHNALAKWRGTKETARALNLKAGAKETGFSSVTKAGRQMLQILILGAGGALAITQQISPGAIVAGSIILGRALGPIDQIVGSWRGIASARLAWNQVQTAIERDDVQPNYTPLPRPDAHLKIDRLSVAIPGNREALIRPFGFEFSGGQMVAILGSNGCGKTTLLQTLAGAWIPHSGSVVLGGRDLHAWDSEDRGQYIGYVPQDVELLPGTVGENIARMTQCDTQDIIDAAKKAGAHEMILSLSEGYETLVGKSGIGSLSAGQRQLIGLARALFGNPVLILLDEPTANLDPMAVYHAISNLNKIAKSGSLVITATHDPKLIAATKSVLVVREGGILTADTKQYLEASKPKPRAANAPIQRLATVGAV